jgi:hypothetical protein
MSRTSCGKPRGCISNLPRTSSLVSIFVNSSDANLTRRASDISYTTPPDWVYLPHDGGEPHMAMWPLASLAFPSKRKDLNTPELSPLHKVSLPPDEQLLCYDSLYYTGVQTVSFLHPPPFSPLEVILDIRVRRGFFTCLAIRGTVHALGPKTAGARRQLHPPDTRY